MYIQTYAAMAAYYKRKGDSELNHYYLNELANRIFRTHGVNPRVVPLAAFLSRLLGAIKRGIGFK